jgi:uncharacterized protein YcbK (DUF882 family)
MPESNLDRRSFLKTGALGLLAAPLIVKTATAAAAAPPRLATRKDRSLGVYHLHMCEKLNTVYWQGGEFFPPSLADINRVLRDHRTNEKHEIDPKLLDLLCDLRLRLDTGEPLQIISGYRSPKTNAMLHDKSNGVVERSMHLVGKAIDIRIPGRDLSLLRKTALSIKGGGVGYYPSSNFVHVDVGRVRSW